MSNLLWTLPVPSTALYNSPHFQMLLGRTCALSFEYEDENESVRHTKLLFEGVEAFKCTYYQSCNVETIKTAYDKLVDVGRTQWLSEIEQNLNEFEGTKELKHLMIYFDDGPCYEFICRLFRVELNEL